MKVIAIVIASFWLGSAAMAQGAMAPAADTPSVAAGKKCQDAKLHGAALTSHVKSCCEKAAAKLKGGAKTSFEGSCEKTGMGT
jgi:hypothetical protein